MIDVLKKIWRFAGAEQGNIRTSIIGSFIFAVFHMFQVGAIYCIILALTSGARTRDAAWMALALLLVSIIGRAVTNRFTQLQQTHAGYFMVANRRLAIGDKLKRVPMGYFNDKSLGALTGVATTVLDMVETMGPMVLVGMMSGLINSAVFVLCLLVFDWRIGLLAVCGALLYLAVLSRMEKRSQALAPRRQASEEEMVDAVLEQLKGMSVIKSFNLTGRGDARVREALANNCRSNLAIEALFAPYTAAQEIVLHVFSVLIMGAAVWFYLAGSMTLANALMTVVIAFMVFSQIQSAGSAVAGLRLVASSMDEADSVETIPEMDEGGQAFDLDSHSIVLEHVDFSYGEGADRPILRDVSLTIPEGSTTAIVGPSGSGKTTLCHLIARFWDVDSGRITLGGHDVRDFSLASLMANISMVFQNVYLFADTIENNIRFGVPNASREDVVAAAKRACCHDFIMKLPQGYDTVIGEGGASLSGGERQRISIARALLKDAPIIILDEATASVDPENEAELQQAIEALTDHSSRTGSERRSASLSDSGSLSDAVPGDGMSISHRKTVIMIAHRLNTVRHADQIVVLDDARIVQQGTHDDLVARPGLYRDFVQARAAANRWKLSATAEENVR